jgi:hypothetical protein
MPPQSRLRLAVLSTPAISLPTTLQMLRRRSHGCAADGAGVTYYLVEEACVEVFAEYASFLFTVCFTDCLGLKTSGVISIATTFSHASFQGGASGKIFTFFVVISLPKAVLEALNT